MSDTLQAGLALVARQEVVVSDHGYDELAADAISVQEILTGVRDAIVVEDYPTYANGPLRPRPACRIARANPCMWSGASQKTPFLQR
jgi:hypothetical protein